MKVLFLPTLNAGVTYWRMYNFWKAAFRTNAFNCHLLWWKKDLTTIQPWQVDIKKSEYKHRILGEINVWAADSDIIVMQMPVTHEALQMFYALKDAYPNKPIVAEADDNMLSTPQYNPASEVYFPGSQFQKYAIDQFKSADAMVVTTPSLKEVYGEFCNHIYEVPNCIDFELWGKLKRKKRKGITIGWAGGASHNEDLNRVRLVIKRILKNNKDVRFVMCHGIPKEFRNMKNVECVYKFVRIDKYPQHLAKQGFDIFIAPLVDNAFNRGKSNLRWLEGSALSIPTVASNVGHFKETINDGVDGFLADNETDFEAKLQRLIDSRKLRKKMSKEANARVRRDFNVDYQVLKYRDILQEILDRGTKPKDTVEAGGVLIES